MWGAAPTCTDINECNTNNGGCGNALHWQCTNNYGAAPTCSNYDECALGWDLCEENCHDIDNGYYCSCSGSQVLDSDYVTCVECTSNSHCFGTQICDSSSNTCRGCYNDAECTNGVCLIIDIGPGPWLSIPSGTAIEGICVECTSDAHCPGANSVCQSYSCVDVECTNAADCGTPPQGKYFTCSSNQCNQNVRSCPTGSSGWPNCSCDPGYIGDLSWNTNTSNWSGICYRDDGGCELSSSGTHLLPFWALLILLGFSKRSRRKEKSRPNTRY